MKDIREVQQKQDWSPLLGGYSNGWFGWRLDHARSESIVDGDDQDGNITIAAVPTTQTEITEHDGEEYSSFFV